jgi:hypothetical protein
MKQVELSASKMNNLIERTEQQLATRKKIDEMENAMKEMVEKGEAKQTIEDCKKDNSQAKHYFGDNVYCRSLLIPKDTAVVGHIHKQDRVCIIAKGKCTFTDEFHSETVESGWVGEFKAGSKTAVFAHEDTIWVACLGTEINDPDIVVDKLLVESFEDYEESTKLIEGI